ncbi:MAG: carboxypeptidase regulatory-like domain-containing protein [Gammaproteobacteria bacterium]|nr:carboxypeptidase regulatory-like domain-containing protein [Gammaproteobacteria bacterium]
MVIEGEGLAGVTVTLIGGPSDENFTMMTDADGMYRFEDLRPGDYTVSISDFDTRDYEFAATSQDVSVDLDETGTVSFTGVLLRTSGISGRVSVEGMGLDGIAVTLSGAADGTKTTDAGGQYSFSGLAAGDYTVTIAVDDPAYVFDSMSQDRTVGDDDSQIVNFEGQHARTASVSGQAFLDELDKNDMMDAGEHPLPAANIPVALVGPGVNDQRLSATGPDGSFSFPGLRAGSYQLVVPIDATAAAALAANDVAYGGPGTGYAFALGVGERKSQAVPFDITHTTVNFSVSLRSGDEMGDALPGAMVTLYGTGGANVGSGTTDDDGSAVIKVARAMTSGNMVNAGVSAEGYDVADGMTAVSWDPQMFATAGANSNDIVNLNVDVSISGATVDRGDYGGGEPLAGWALMGDGPDELGDDGTVTFTTTVDAVPASFSFAVADDQDDALDGGEMYESSGGGYVHTGLSLAGNMDADPIVVTYTTQTLKVYVHHERDQVRGYTGNVLGGDARAAGLVDLEVRHATGSGGRFTSPISSDDWDARANSGGSRGAYTFSHLPANMDIVVRADARDGYMLLDLDRIDTYRNMEENGVMGGAFGAMGGSGHTVTLCPLTEVEPTGQDFGKCGSFAVVTTHGVTANVSKNGVRKSGVGFRENHPSDVRQSGITVSLDPVDGKNLAGVGREFTTASSNDPTTEIDERTDHNFGTMAAGAYALGLPDGWAGMVGDARASASGDSGPLSPLGAGGHGTDVHIDVRPTTATLYGFVRNIDNAGLEGVTVTVNGMTATTDHLGRYIVSGISHVRRQLFVNTARAGYPETKADSTNNPDTEVPGFAANSVSRWDFALSGANNTVAITGTVTESGTNAPIKGVRIKVDGKNPLNGLPSGSRKGQLLTGDDGTYTALVPIQPNNDPLVTVSASKSGYHFIPPSTPVAALASTNPTANFTGYAATEITGRVTAPGGNVSMSDVTVTAYDDPAMEKEDSLYAVTTTETGTFSVFVPTLSGTVYLEAEPRALKQADYSTTNYQNLLDAMNYVWFDAPATRPGGAIAVIPGQVLQFGTFSGHSVQPRINSVTRKKVTDPYVGSLVNGEPTNVVEVKWEHDTRSASGAYSAAGGAGAAPTLTTSADASGEASTPAATTTATDGVSVTHKRTTTYTIPATRAKDYGKIGVKVGISVNGADGTSATATSAKVDLAAVPSGVTGLKAAINVTETSGSSAPNAHTITASWSGPGSPALEHRIALEVQVPATTGTWEWVVFDGSPHAQPGITRNTTPGKTDFGQWKMGGYNLSSGGGRWPDDDSGDTYQLSVEQLRNVRALRVDTRVDGGEWMKHAATSSIDRTSKPYKPSSDASLGSLTLSQGTLTPAFSSTVGTYTANVGNDVASIMMGLGTPTGATIEVTRITADGRLSLTGANGVYVVDLVVGSNVIEIKLTSEDRSATKTYTVTVTRGTVRLSVPRSLYATSSGSGQLTVGWSPSATIEAGLQALGYQIRADDTETWTDVTTGYMHEVHAATVGTDGTEYTYWVRAKATDPTDGSDVFSEAVSVSGTPWPTVTGTWSAGTIDEDGGESTLTITASGTTTSGFTVRVSVSVDGDGEEGNADAVMFQSEVEIPAGPTTAPSATIEFTAVDDVADGDKTIVVDMMLAESEAAGRDPVAAPDLTITDDDEVPGAVRNLTLDAGDASITAHWIIPESPGTSTITGYQYRTYVTSDGAPAADAATQGWKSATSPQAITTVTTATGTPSLVNATEYTVEVRAVSAAGEGTVASATATPASS